MTIKICIISVSLGKGGLERSCANLSVLLSEAGYDVHLVSLNDDVDYAFKGELFNLGQYKDENDNLPKRLLRFRQLRKYFRDQKFDYIIDSRIGNNPWRELYYMLYIYGLRAKVIYMQHSGRLATHMPSKSLISKAIVKYAYAIVGVSLGIKEAFNALYNTQKCQTIYNSIEPILPQEDSFVFPEKYVLYLGRLDDKTKNFRLMLSSFKLSGITDKVKLLIMGDGPDKSLIKNYIDEYALGDRVVLRPFSETIFQALSGAEFLLLTSRHEGFPMTLIEALSCGTPVVSVDCHTGPNEIVRQEENGLLVENLKPQALEDAIRRMYEDKEFNNKCRSNAKASIAHLSKEKIAEQWRALLA